MSRTDNPLWLSSASFCFSELFLDKPAHQPYDTCMHIIARKMLLDFSAKYPDAKKPLESWWNICRKNDFSSFGELKKTFGTADLVGKCVIFDIGGTKYRLVVRVNFTAQRMWIKYILPHVRYDKLKLKEDSKCLP